MTAALAVGVGAALYFLFRGAKNTAKDTVNTAGNLAAGVVVGLGNQVGIPDTDKNECAKALAEGRYWDASFACPAGTFIKGVFGSSDAKGKVPARATANAVAKLGNGYGNTPVF